MAEFSEVVKHKKRLCQSEMECSYCPLALGNNGKRMSCDEFEMQYPEEYEAIVMKWAKEHPAMTNADKFKEVFGFHITVLPARCYEECDNLNDCFWNKEYQPPKEE